MDGLQVIIFAMGISGQLLIARKKPAGYVCWIIGNICLICIYAPLRKHGLIALQVINISIQLYALLDWGAFARFKMQFTHLKRLW